MMKYLQTHYQAAIKASFHCGIDYYKECKYYEEAMECYCSESNFNCKYINCNADCLNYEAQTEYAFELLKSRMDSYRSQIKGLRKELERYTTQRKAENGYQL